jgi:hypothetical protein
LRALFEAYNRQVEGDDHDVAVDQLALDRAETEITLERLRLGIR